jgi:molybdenum cofactor cytidylyltransferase
MGEPKQLMRYGGETLLRRAVRTALDSRCRPAVVVLGARSELLIEEAAGARVVINQEWTEGMASSIRCGLSALDCGLSALVEETRGRTEAVVFTLCDQPFVTGEIVNRLLEAYETERPPLVASRYPSASRHPAGDEITLGVPALFSRELFRELMELRGDEGARRIIRRHASEAATVNVPEAVFDVDTREDYLRLQSGAALTENLSPEK